MRFPELLTAVSFSLLLASSACQRNVAVTTPTDPPQTGNVNGVSSTPAPTSANTIEPTPVVDAQFAEGKRPQWLSDRIQHHLNEKKQNPPVQIMSYLFNGKRVFYETVGCCDQYTTLYDAAGKVLCHPDGGLTGRGDGNCADFAKNRTEERLVWQDPR